MTSRIFQRENRTSEENSSLFRMGRFFLCDMRYVYWLKLVSPEGWIFFDG